MLRSLCASAVLIIAGFATPLLSAQELVNWRHDYSSARREAVQTGKPLFLDFGTEACVYCRKLDATTFRSRAIADTLNTQFIPVKIDADKAPRLVQALNIQGYPEVIAAAPDGTILGRHPGYADTSAMSGLLENSLRKMPKPVAAAPSSGAVPASMNVPVPAATALAPAMPSPTKPIDDPNAENWKSAREDILRKLTQVHLDRGAELCRRGRTEEGEQHLGVAASLSPDSQPAGAAREMLQKLKTSDKFPRP